MLFLVVPAIVKILVRAVVSAIFVTTVFVSVVLRFLLVLTVLVFHNIPPYLYYLESDA